MAPQAKQEKRGKRLRFVKNDFLRKQLAIFPFFQ